MKLSEFKELLDRMENLDNIDLSQIDISLGFYIVDENDNKEISFLSKNVESFMIGNNNFAFLTIQPNFNNDNKTIDFLERNN